MERVVILGRGGAGKSVLARRLGEVTGLPVIELDARFWNAQLDPLPPEEWRREQEQIASGESWIMDGDLGPRDQLAPRLRRADTVVVLDMPLWLCALRTCRRGHEGRDYWRWTVLWRLVSRPRLLEVVAAAPAMVVVLRSPRSVRRWLAAARR